MLRNAFYFRTFFERCSIALRFFFVLPSFIVRISIEGETKKKRWKYEEKGSIPLSFSYIGNIPFNTPRLMQGHADDVGRVDDTKFSHYKSSIYNITTFCSQHNRKQKCFSRETFLFVTRYIFECSYSILELLLKNRCIQ